MKTQKELQEEFKKLSPAQAIKFAIKKLHEKEWTIDQYNRALKAHKEKQPKLEDIAEEIFCG